MLPILNTMKRYVAPVLSAIGAGIVIIAIGVFYFRIFKEIPGGSVIGFIAVTGVLAGLGVLIAVLIQRIKELKGGEEDDLGKY